MNSPENVRDFMNEFLNLKYRAEEYVYVMGLDTKGNILGIFELSHGSVDCSIVSVREIFTRLLLCGTSRFIMAHNHPSGDPSPSREDIEVTSRLKSAGEMLQISLVDHIIIGEDHYFSFKEDKLWKES